MQLLTEIECNMVDLPLLEEARIFQNLFPSYVSPLYDHQELTVL